MGMLVQPTFKLPQRDQESSTQPDYLQLVPDVFIKEVPARAEGSSRLIQRKSQPNISSRCHRLRTSKPTRWGAPQPIRPARRERLAL